MNMNFDKEMSLYKMVLAVKKANKDSYNGGILFNQKVLTACGKIHAAMLQLIDVEKFKSDNKEFFDSFAWTYYCAWRKIRAKSCAHSLDVYKLLNVKLGVDNFVGETFYAGIPVVTAEEINEAVQTCQVDLSGLPIGPGDGGFSYEKIGIDGQLHATDKLGEFEPWSDSNDIYGDNSGVTLEQLHEFNKEDEEPEPFTQCYTCKHMGGDGKICEECEGWK